MDLIEAGKFYIELMLKDAGDGIKAMLLDSHTLKIVNLHYTQSEMLERCVFLISQLPLSSETLSFMTAIIFIHPTNISLLLNELKFPKFANYMIYFCNSCPSEYIEDIANFDDDERVLIIKELNLDYFVMGNSLFSFDLENIYETNGILREDSFASICTGLSSVINSLGLHPEVKYQSSSQNCTKLATELKTILHLQSPEDYDSQLILVDRNIDPIIPLLNSWTYEAMIHELIGIKNKIVKFSPGGSKNVTMALNTSNSFFIENRLAFYDEIVSKVSAAIEEVRKISDDRVIPNSMDGIKEFVEKYGPQRKWINMITQHSDLVSTLTKIASDRCLFDVSLLEQDIVCSNQDFAQIIQKIAVLFVDNSTISAQDTIRLAILCLIRFPECANYKLEIFNRHLLKLNVPSQMYQIPQSFQRSVQSRPGKTSSNISGLVSQWREKLKSTVSSSSAVNLYKRYKPHLVTILEDISRNSLSSTEFSSSEPFNPFSNKNVKKIDERIQSGGKIARKVIVFVVGGVTYAENSAVHSVNLGIDVVLGGTRIHNFDSYSREISEMVKK